MEKRLPHVPLVRVLELAAAGRVRATMTAFTDADRLGFGRPAMIVITLRLEKVDFYKSMTTYGDHTIWQDVYRPMSEIGRLSIKLTVADDVLIVSFKEM
jgi:motility quorum-sensing regulator/GCU-specific mRNA interferase toxin